MTTHSEPGHGRPDPGLDAIMGERRQLINLTYRLLGSLAEAEDAVQETYARWYALSRHQQEAIESPGAWLTTVASRICLTQLRSARARRETYVGEWLPEPLPERTAWISGRQGGTTADPADRVTLRQLASSGRRRVRASQPPASLTARQAGIVRDVKQAWEARDISALIGLLDPGATAIADSGGLVAAALRPIEGAGQIARYMVDLADRAPGLTILERTVNGQPGLIVQQDGVTVAVAAFEIAGDRVKRIWAMRNPEKLRLWTMS
jgi:RNA polymerase sigma-70 factor (ECF subfamily)